MSQPGNNSQTQGNKPIEPVSRGNGDVTLTDGSSNTDTKYLGGLVKDTLYLQPGGGTPLLASNNNNLRILYITLAIIIGILLLWIIIVIFTKEDPIKILNEMTDLTKQLTPVSDFSGQIQTPQQIIQMENIVNDPVPI